MIRPEIEEVLHDFAVGLHEYANGKANGLVYGKELNKAAQAIEALIKKSNQKLLDRVERELPDRPDKYDLHKACDHDTDKAWGLGYNDGYFDTIAQTKATINKIRGEL